LPIMWRSDARLTERNWGDLDELKKLLGCCFEGIVACIQANTQNI